jgi:DNA polymerase-3 subunit epsilon
MVGTFFAIDVETANASMHSICQIGLVGYRDGEEILARSWLVDPRCEFDDQNIRVHGIHAAMVAGQPAFDALAGEVAAIVEGQVLVSHTHYDRVATARACEHHSVPIWQCQWLDSAVVVRRTWPEFARSGYGLANIAAHLGIAFRHHDALEDARAAAQVLLRACELRSVTVNDWLHLASQPLSARYPERLSREGSEDGPLAGERIVFTGSLAITRAEAADLCSALGAAVDPGVTKKTTIVVVGDRDLVKFGGKPKSGKHVRAEELISQGKPIRIIGESDFLAMTQMVGNA